MIFYKNRFTVEDTGGGYWQIITFLKEIAENRGVQPSQINLKEKPFYIELLLQDLIRFSKNSWEFRILEEAGLFYSVPIGNGYVRIMITPEGTKETYCCSENYIRLPKFEYLMNLEEDDLRLFVSILSDFEYKKGCLMISRSFSLATASDTLRRLFVRKTEVPPIANDQTNDTKEAYQFRSNYLSSTWIPIKSIRDIANFDIDHLVLLQALAAIVEYKDILYFPVESAIDLEADALSFNNDYCQNPFADTDANLFGNFGKEED